MIVAYAGRRPGSEDFPAANVEEVGARIEQMLAGLRPARVVGSAAAGADLLVLEAAERLGIKAEVVLVGDVGSFRESSVADKGGDWVARYDHAIDRLSPELVPASEDEQAGYRAVTKRIIERARELLSKDEALVVLVVSRPRADGGHTEDLARHGAEPGRLLLRIDSSLDAQLRKRAFVAMPFGRKAYPERGWQQFDADLSYNRIMVPALIDGGYRPLRADTDALLEIIDHTMLREISAAPVMIADLAMLNANVMWELGLRHAWRRSGTILIAPKWIKHPFDIQRVPTFPYERGARSIADAAVVKAIQLLQRALAAVGEGRVDSPVFANVGDLPEVVLPAPAGTGEGTAGELLEACTLAADRGDVTELIRLADEMTSADDLPEVTKGVLLEQIGFRLLALDRYPDALRLLEPLAESDKGLQRRRLQEQYAHALIRTDESASEDDEPLLRAEGTLRALRYRYGSSGEVLGLLGSATKRRVERAVEAGQTPPPVYVEAAISAYRSGLESDPGDPYPGINAVALLRLRGQRWGGMEDDLAEARAMLPVVLFAASRPGATDDEWTNLTLGECHLHAYLLDGDTERLRLAQGEYRRSAARIEPQQRRSADRQLRLMRAAGDPAEVMGPLLALFSG